MGRVRTRELTSQEQASAASIAAVLGGAALVGVGAGAAVVIPGLSVEASAIAMILFLSVPGPEISRMGEKSTLDLIIPLAATVASSDPARTTTQPDEYGILARRAKTERLMRGRFAVNALRRVLTSRDRGRQLRAEVENFKSQLSASQARWASDRALATTASEYGPVLGWRHGLPERPRTTHERADGRNFDVRRALPPEIGALPGILYGCTCRAVRPFTGARLLNATMEEVA